MSQHADRVRREYLDLLSEIDERPFGTASSSLRSTIHSMTITSADLAHLRDLKFLNAVITYSRSRFLIISSPTFAPPRSSYMIDLNHGQTASHKRSQTNIFLNFESEVFAILVSLRLMQPVPEHLHMHARFHVQLLKQVTQLLEDLDTFKEIDIERNRTESVLYILTASSDFLLPRFAIDHALHSSLLLPSLVRQLAIIWKLVVPIVQALISIALLSIMFIFKLYAFLRDRRAPPFESSTHPGMYTRVCCPGCFALCPPWEILDRCHYPSGRGSTRCGTRLFQTRIIRGNYHRIPRQFYAYQTMREWIGELFSRMSSDNISLCYLNTGSFRDPLRRGVLHPFYEEGGNEGLPLMFSLRIDTLQRQRDVLATGTVQLTKLYMICLNLSPQIRYVPGNVYVAGILASPLRPTADRLDHLLGPLIEDLESMWNSGVRCLPTTEHPNGRLIRPVLVSIEGDFPADKLRF